jgi:hypothetical protein
VYVQTADYLNITLNGSASIPQAGDGIELRSDAASRWSMAWFGQGVSTSTASALMRRDSNGRASVAEPSSSTDIATKNYVDLTRSFCQVKGSSSTAMSNGSWIPLVNWAADVQTGGVSQYTVTASTGITVLVAGTYLIHGGTTFNGSTSSSRRGLRITRNTTALNGSEIVIENSYASAQISVVVPGYLVSLAANDVINLQGFADVASISTQVGGAEQPLLNVLRVA